MRVVTGATGLIGAAIVARLIEAGHAVVGVARRQRRMRDLAAAAARRQAPPPPLYRRLFQLWFAFGFPAFAAVPAFSG